MSTYRFIERIIHHRRIKHENELGIAYYSVSNGRYLITLTKQ